MENQETSVGAVIYKIVNDKILFLLVYSARNSEWGFPKGHAEIGETEIETAKREIKEETGIAIVDFLKGFRFTDTYKIKGTLPSTKDRIIDKNVIYYLGNTKSEFKGSVDDEISNYQWLELKDALAYVKFNKHKELLNKANEFIMEVR